MDQKRYFCAKNRIWCNNTLPLFGLNMRFFVVKIHQHYSGIEQQIHYRLCSRPWENSSHIFGNGNLMTQYGVRTEYNCKEIQTKQPSWLKPQSPGKWRLAWKLLVSKSAGYHHRQFFPQQMAAAAGARGRGRHPASLCQSGEVSRYGGAGEPGTMTQHLHHQLVSNRRRLNVFQFNGIPLQ